MSSLNTTSVNNDSAYWSGILWLFAEAESHQHFRSAFSVTSIHLNHPDLEALETQKIFRGIL